MDRRSGLSVVLSCAIYAPSWRADHRASDDPPDGGVRIHGISLRRGTRTYSRS